MNPVYTVTEIIDKLQNTFAGEGLRFVAHDYDKNSRQLNVSLERFAPGVPVAFMVKGLQGTLRRYLDSESTVILQDYKVLPSAREADSQSNPKLQKAILQGVYKKTRSRIKFNNYPGLDLSEAKKGEASLALESLQSIAESQGLDTIAVKASSEFARKVLRQWASINGFVYHKHIHLEDTWIVHLQDGFSLAKHDVNTCCPAGKFDFIPLQILVISPPEEK